MTWLIFRQYRPGFLVSAPFLLALVAFFLMTGIGLNSALREAGVSSCIFTSAPSGDCLFVARQVLDDYRWTSSIMPWLNFLPAIIAVVIAAPLISEFEQRTYHLAWTQSIGRGKWLAWKLLFAGALAVAISTALTLLSSWWYGPVNAIEGRWGNSFNLTGPVFITYTLFAVALCLAIGVFTKRALPAFAITVVVFFIVRIAVENMIRPHYLAQKLQVSPVADRVRVPDGSWVVSERFVTADGAELVQRFAMVGDRSAQMIQAEDGVFLRILFHPASRYWTFQAIESAIFLGAAAILVAVSAWWVHRRFA